MVVFICVFVNTFLTGLLPTFDIFIIFFHIAGFIAIVATSWTFTPIGSAHFVFGTA